MKMLSKNNLFAYATSELSQDAFIAWLMSFAMKEFEDKDVLLTKCARDVIKIFYPDMKDDEYVTDIKKQYLNIDILVKIGDKCVIIEDKTFTGTHGDQINRYKEALIKEGVAEENIICVYYKTGNQARQEPHAINIFRPQLLEIFSKYYESVNNVIFKDYVDSLRYWEDITNAYTTEPIDTWWRETYQGFFMHLVDNHIISNHDDEAWSWSWDYVNNQSGGFSCLWWQPMSADEVRHLKIGEYISEVYLEIEDSIIVVKLSTNGIEYKDSKKDVVRNIRWAIYEKMKEILGAEGLEYEKGRFQPGVHMSAGNLKYDFSNYRERIEAIEKAILEICRNYEYDLSRGLVKTAY